MHTTATASHAQSTANKAKGASASLTHQDTHTHGTVQEYKKECGW